MKQNGVLNYKSYPSTVVSFFGPILSYYAVARWAFEVEFFIEVGLLDGSYLDFIFLNPVYDFVQFLVETTKIQLKNVEVCVVVSQETPCLTFYYLAPGAAPTVKLVVPLLCGQHVGAIHVYPSSTPAPDAALIPVATVINSTTRWAGVCFNAAEDEEKKQGKYVFLSSTQIFLRATPCQTVYDCNR